jgi:hypothetical protein
MLKPSYSGSVDNHETQKRIVSIMEGRVKKPLTEERRFTRYGNRRTTKILAQGEDSKNQFKKDVNNADSLAQELIAFSNTLGGKIFVGVE